MAAERVRRSGEGEAFIIVGPPGAGKTELLRGIAPALASTLRRETFAGIDFKGGQPLAWRMLVPRPVRQIVGIVSKFGGAKPVVGAFSHTGGVLNGGASSFATVSQLALGSFERFGSPVVSSPKAAYSWTSSRDRFSVVEIDSLEQAGVGQRDEGENNLGGWLPIFTRLIERIRSVPLLLIIAVDLSEAPNGPLADHVNQFRHWPGVSIRELKPITATEVKRRYGVELRDARSILSLTDRTPRDINAFWKIHRKHLSKSQGLKRLDLPSDSMARAVEGKFIADISRYTDFESELTLFTCEALELASQEGDDFTYDALESAIPHLGRVGKMTDAESWLGKLVDAGLISPSSRPSRYIDIKSSGPTAVSRYEFNDPELADLARRCAKSSSISKAAHTAYISRLLELGGGVTTETARSLAQIASAMGDPRAVKFKAEADRIAETKMSVEYSEAMARRRGEIWGYREATAAADALHHAHELGHFLSLDEDIHALEVALDFAIIGTDSEVRWHILSDLAMIYADRIGDLPAAWRYADPLARELVDRVSGVERIPSRVGDLPWQDLGTALFAIGKGDDANVSGLARNSLRNIAGIAKDPTVIGLSNLLDALVLADPATRAKALNPLVDAPLPRHACRWLLARLGHALIASEQYAPAEAIISRLDHELDGLSESESIASEDFHHEAWFVKFLFSLATERYNELPGEVRAMCSTDTWLSNRMAGALATFLLPVAVDMRLSTAVPCYFLIMANRLLEDDHKQTLHELFGEYIYSLPGVDADDQLSKAQAVIVRDGGRNAVEYIALSVADMLGDDGAVAE